MMKFNIREMSRDWEQYDVRYYTIIYYRCGCRDPINGL